MLAVGDSLWVAINDLDRLVRITPDRGVTASVRMPGGSSIFDEFDPQLGSGSDGRTLWSMTAGKELVAVDVATGKSGGPHPHQQRALPLAGCRARRHRLGPAERHIDRSCSSRGETVDAGLVNR